MFYRVGLVRESVDITQTQGLTNCNTRVTYGHAELYYKTQVQTDVPSPAYSALMAGLVPFPDGHGGIAGGGLGGQWAGLRSYGPGKSDAPGPQGGPVDPQSQLVTSLGGLPDGTQLVTNDTQRIYKIVGGAPVWQATCADGICQPASRPTTQAVIDSGQAVPRDGSSAIDQRGRIYQFVGGAPIWQDTCAAPLSCGSPVKVSDWSIDAFDHMNRQPSDGHLVQGWDGNTGLPVAETVGGALVPFETPQEVIDTGYGTDWRTKVTALSSKSYNAIGFVPADGTLVQGAGGAATPVAVMLGGARINVASPQELQDIGYSGDWAGLVRAVPTRAFNLIPADVPRNGTLIQGAGGSSTPVAQIVDGQRVNFGSPQDVIDAGYGADWPSKVKAMPSRAFSLIAERQTTTRGRLYGQLSRYVGKGRHLVITGQAPDGYRLEGSLGELLLAQQPGTHPLYDCQYGGGQFTSRQADCEGQHVNGLLGWLYDSPPTAEQTLAVYRCLAAANGDHFDSTDPACEGQTTEGLQGYTLAYAHLARYAKDGGGHVVTTAGVPDGYHLEATLGLVNLNAVPGTAALYNCHYSGGYFSSLDSGCEGYTRVSGNGYLWKTAPAGVPTVPVYRCTVTATGDHFDSSDPACEGQHTEWLFGYARAPFYSGGTGKADLVSADANGDLRLFGNADALAFNWTGPQVVKNVQADPARIFFADLTGSGRKDLILDNQDGTLTAWPNTGSGWGTARQIGSGWNDPARIRFADLNGDGKADLIAVGADGSLRAFRNIDGIDGTWADAVGFGGGFTDPARVLFADLNGDGKAEAIAVNADGTLTAWPNYGVIDGGSWGTPRQIGSGWNDPARIRFADLNGDGKAEVISIDADGTLRAFRDIDGINANWVGAVQIGSGWNTPARTLFA
ncbi:hypothetical protein CFP65_1989 [Kitasatospora sp. MMS16-BH015]|nr:hypothetical protein CFP65_1989 [Kitasatospora sp. MMS16-BH015]